MIVGFAESIYIDASLRRRKRQYMSTLREKVPKSKYVRYETTS